MRNYVKHLILVGVIFALIQCDMVYADVTIKVRALNPLETTETAVIKYPLPNEVSLVDVISKKITYSMDHSEDEDPPKTDFQISYDEEAGGYFIDDEVIILSKEIITLEVRVKDIWLIDLVQIENIKREVNSLLDEWENQVQEIPKTEEEVKEEEETMEFALMMKQEIMDSLDGIIKRQEKNSILNVGVEKHLIAYNDNMKDLRQIQQDIVLLANLIQFSATEEQPQEPEEGEPEEVLQQDVEKTNEESLEELSEDVQEEVTENFEEEIIENKQEENIESNQKVEEAQSDSM